MGKTIVYVINDTRIKTYSGSEFVERLTDESEYYDFELGVLTADEAVKLVRLGKSVTDIWLTLKKFGREGLLEVLAKYEH